MSDDHQKIHPLNDPEAPPPHPTVPLVTRGDPTEQSPPLDSQRKKKKKESRRRRRSWLRCVFLFLFLLIITIGAIVGILYLVFKPQLPDYNIDRLQLSRFQLNQDLSLSTSFNVTITAKNPNQKIGFYYEDGSRISVFYMPTKLSNDCNLFPCRNSTLGRPIEFSRGSLPKFYQGHENTTLINVEMIGVNQNATSLITTLREHQSSTGSIPLRIRVNQPVRIKLGRLKLMEIRVLVRCVMSVDNLASNSMIRVTSSTCHYKLRF